MAVAEVRSVAAMWCLLGVRSANDPRVAKSFPGIVLLLFAHR